MQIKQTLPVIDPKLANMKLPGTCDRFVTTEFDHIDFQSTNQTIMPVQSLASTQFKPQDDYDDSNRFFMQTRFAQMKLLQCPLASLTVSEIKDHSAGHNFFFGAAQTDLVYLNAEENNSIAATQPYYKSSTPLIAVIKYLQNKRQDVKEPNKCVNDIGFCVRSDPAFLYQIAKMCLEHNMFIDLAVQSLHLYWQGMSYYRHFNDWQYRKQRGWLMLAMLLKQHNDQQDSETIEKITD